MSLLNRMFGWIFGSKNSWWNPLSANKNLLRNIVYGDSSSSSNTNAFTNIFGTTLPDLIHAITNRYTAEHMTGADREAAELSYQQQEQFYNDYQSPLAQVRQYQQAGLNPALMFSKGASVPSPISGNASAQGASLDPLSLISGIMGLGLRAKEVQAELELKSADAYRQRQEGDLIKKRNQIFYDEWSLNRRILGKRIDNIDADTSYKLSSIELNRAGITEKEANTALLNWQSLLAQIDADYRDDLNQSILDLRQAEIAVKNSEIRFNNARSAESENALNEAKQTFKTRKETLEASLLKLQEEGKITKNEVDYWLQGKSLEALSIQSEAFQNYLVNNPFGFGKSVHPYSPDYNGIVEGTFFTNPYAGEGVNTPVVVDSGTSVQSKGLLERWFDNTFNSTYSDRINRKKGWKKQTRDYIESEYNVGNHYNAHYPANRNH